MATTARISGINRTQSGVACQVDIAVYLIAFIETLGVSSAQPVGTLIISEGRFGEDSSGTSRQCVSAGDAYVLHVNSVIAFARSEYGCGAY